MKMWKKIVLCVILAIIGVSAGVMFSLFKPYLTSDPSAILNIETGKVEINKGSEWEIATNGLKLREGWGLKTNDESEAEILFFGGSVARFNENSEMRLEEIDEEEKNVYIEQLGGDLWYNTLDGSGITFLIETPEGVFTNEGCIFRVTTTPSAGVVTAIKTLTEVSVSSGFITMGSKGQTPVTQPAKSKARTLIDSMRNDTNRYILLREMTATIKQNKSPTFKPLVLDNWAEKNKAKDEVFVVRRREQLKKRYGNLINLVKTAYPELTDELINGYIDEVLQGKIDIKQKIQDGTIPPEYVRLIPKEFISTKPIPPSTTTEDVKTSISEVWPPQLGISSPLPPEERLVSTGEDPEMREVDLHILGQNFATLSQVQVIFFPGEGMGVSHVSVFDSENILATIHIEKNAIQTGPKAILIFDKNSPTAQAKFNSAVNVQASLSKEEELRLDGWILRNKLRKYMGYKANGHYEEAARWMLSIMRELDVLPPARGAGPGDEDENRLLFGLKQAIVAGAEDIAQSPIPTETLNVLLEMYTTLAKFFDPKTAGGRTTLTNKLQNRGFTLEESQDLLDEMGGVYTRLGPRLRQ